MLGRYLYTLRALQDGRLRPTPGKQLHGALFSLLHEVDAAFADALHDAPDKPFAMTQLFRGRSVPAWDAQAPQRVAEGDTFSWQISGLSEEMLRRLAALPIGTEFSCNDIRWRLASCATRRDEHPLAGRIEEASLIRFAQEAAAPRHITIEFLTPTTFHRNHRTCAWPSPAALFPSLAIRWSRLGLAPSLDDQAIQALAGDILPGRWNGHTVTIDFDRKQRFEGFVGTFAYNLVLLPEEQRRALLLLARFAEFSGIGRMTTHGLGTVRVQADGAVPLRAAAASSRRC